MAKKQPPGEPPPERPFGEVWPRDREPSSRKSPSETLPVVAPPNRAMRVCRFVWRRIARPFLLWGKDLIKRACDELLVFSLKAIALTTIVAVLGGSIILQNYSLRHIVNTLSKQHGIETGSIHTEPRKPSGAETQQMPLPPQPAPPQKLEPPPAVAKRRPMPPKEKPFFDRLIDRIDEALGWKT